MNLDSYDIAKSYFEQNTQNLQEISKFFSEYTLIIETTAVKITKLVDDVKISDNCPAFSSFLTDFTDIMNITATHHWDFAK